MKVVSEYIVEANTEFRNGMLIFSGLINKEILSFSKESKKFEVVSSYIAKRGDKGLNDKVLVVEYTFEFDQRFGDENQQALYIELCIDEHLSAFSKLKEIEKVDKNVNPRVTKLESTNVQY